MENQDEKESEAISLSADKAKIRQAKVKISLVREILSSERARVRESLLRQEEYLRELEKLEAWLQIGN